MYVTDFKAPKYVKEFVRLVRRRQFGKSIKTLLDIYLNICVQNVEYF